MAETSEEAFGRTLKELLALAERAGMHKRQQLRERDAGTEFQRSYFVYHRTPRLPLPQLAPGWFHLTDIIDDLHYERFIVWWEPATDRLRLQTCSTRT